MSATHAPHTLEHWTVVLYRAAMVPAGHPDYAEAQERMRYALARIEFLDPERASVERVVAQGLEQVEEWIATLAPEYPGVNQERLHHMLGRALRTGYLPVSQDAVRAAYEGLKTLDAVQHREGEDR